MIVTCESCKTKFRLDPGRLKGTRSKLRCSRCGHVFTVSQSPEQPLLGTDFSESSVDLDEGATMPHRIASHSLPPRLKQQRKLSSLVLIGACLLVLVLAVYWGSSHMGSLFSTTSENDQTTPSAETEQPTITILDSTQAYFLDNANAGQIFVVEGEVANESSKPVSFVLLEGKLYTTDNHVAQSQRCFGGNLMSRDELTRLNATEIQNRMMNREGKNLSNVHVSPGSRLPFLLVFHNLPELDALSDYSIEVISAKID